MALLVEHPIAPPWVACIWFWGNSIVAVLLLNVVQNFTGSIGFVGQDRTIWNVKMWQYIHCHCRIMDISTGQLKINWVSQTVYNNMDFSRLSPTTCGNKLIIFAVYIPFLAPALCGCALMTVESSDRFSISASSFKNRKIRSRVPSSRHLQKRL